jgi:hypothetical protein
MNACASFLLTRDIAKPGIIHIVLQRHASGTVLKSGSTLIYFRVQYSTVHRAYILVKGEYSTKNTRSSEEEVCIIFNLKQQQ